MLRRKGFSLIELMIAVAIMASAIILVVSVLVAGMKATQKSADLTTGIIVGEFALQGYVQGIFDRNFDTLIGNISGTYTLNNTIYTYQIDVTDIDIDNSKAPPVVKMKNLLVTVSWWGGDSGATRTGDEVSFGMLKTSLSRMVYRNSRY
ncbi:MAG: prepilin-type N-terminal cleavage/methylation domain-containing protein [Firmicutes bacterium]|nr:prepilin-type N-terminal cleavage/methylation domain-containing protein [Bacillota bacterium]